MYRARHILATLIVAMSYAGCIAPAPRGARDGHDVSPHIIVDRPSPSAPINEGMAVALDPLAVPPELAGPQPVNAYIVHALAQNRAVQAARTRTVAIKNRIPQATALDDPTVQNIVWPLPNNGPQYSLMGYMPYELMISQEFPWLGTLRLRGEVAEQELKAALHELAATQLEVVSRVKRAYYTLYFNQRAEDILAESRTLAERVVEIANVKSETGTTTYQDVLRAQNLVTDVDGELVTVRQELASARATLARQLHVSPEAQLGALPELPVEQVPEQVERLYHLAAVARPELQAQLASIAKDHREVELAKKRYYPNITMGLAYGVMSRDNALSPTADGRDNIGLVVGFNLPIYRKKLVAGVCEAEARTIADAQRYEDLRDETYQEVKELFVEAKARQELLDLFRDIYLPRSEQALELATTDYQAATQDFLTLVTSWRELLALRLQIARLESDLGKALASLERVVGAQLNDEPDNTVQPQLTPPPPPGIESPFRLQSRAIDTENSGAAQ